MTARVHKYATRASLHPLTVKDLVHEIQEELEARDGRVVVRIIDAAPVFRQVALLGHGAAHAALSCALDSRQEAAPQRTLHDKHASRAARRTLTRRHVLSLSPYSTVSGRKSVRSASSSQRCVICHR